jgi:hypothetical protein
MELEVQQKVNVKADSAYHRTEFRFFDYSDKEIKL